MCVGHDRTQYQREPSIHERDLLLDDGASGFGSATPLPMFLQPSKCSECLSNLPASTFVPYTVEYFSLMGTSSVTCYPAQCGKCQSVIDKNSNGGVGFARLGPKIASSATIDDTNPFLFTCCFLIIFQYMYRSQPRSMSTFRIGNN